MVVMLRAPALGQPTKLQSKYREKPLQVIQKLPGDTYRVAEIAPEGQSTYATTAHISQLKSWKVMDQEDDMDETGAVDSVGGTSTSNKKIKEKPVTDVQVEATHNDITNEAISPEPVPPTTKDLGDVRGQRVRKTPRYLKDYVPK